MPVFALFPLRVGVAVGVLLTAGASALSAQERVGINSAVNPEATGALPGATARRLVIGQDVIFNEHITTSGSGQTQLLFLDESSMSIGPNSDLTIDQFVYDPKSSTGKLAMSATRGLLRYVGGKLSKQDDAVTLRTPTATLAVRGGAFIAQIGPDGKTNATFLYGKGLTVTGLAGGSQTVTRPGFAVTTAGAAPSQPAPAPAGQLALFTEQLDGRSGSTGGAVVIPTDTIVVNSGIAQTISGNVTQGVQQKQSPTTTATSSAQTTTGSPTNSAGLVIDCVIAGTCNTTTTQVGTTSSGQTVGGSNTISGKSFATPLGDLNTLISQSATGTYTGYAIGTVSNNGVHYAAAGGFTGTYNFGTQTGTMAVSSFDGHNFAATGSAPLSGANYTFAVAQTGIKGTINGTFFGPKAAATTGDFSIQTTAGPTYLASGIFAGKK